MGIEYLPRVSSCIHPKLRPIVLFFYKSVDFAITIWWLPHCIKYVVILEPILLFAEHVEDDFMEVVPDAEGFYTMTHVAAANPSPQQLDSKEVLGLIQYYGT